MKFQVDSLVHPCDSTTSTLLELNLYGARAKKEGHNQRQNQFLRAVEGKKIFMTGKKFVQVGSGPA
jgi:hypothetical protein